LAAMQSTANPLSPRELEVIQLVVDGLSNQEMADALGLSLRTVHAHVSNAMSKTDTSTRTQLAVHALRVGLVPLHSDQDTDD
jgi:DNA-binding NarL/FixJ family response regulator